MLSGVTLDDAFAQTAGGATKAQLTDALGSVVGTADAAGTVTKTPFGAFGETSDATVRAQGYTGREHDGTGLVYMRMRYYSPELKRFISEDPIGLLGGDVNVYAYVGNQPVTATDPMGLMVMGGGGGGCPSPSSTVGNKPAAGAGAGAGGGASGIIGLPSCPQVHPTTPEDPTDPEDETPEWPDGLPKDPNEAPGEPWEWKSPHPEATGKGNYVHPDGTRVNPDPNHGPPQGPHWDIKFPGDKGKGHRGYPDGTIKPK